MVKIRKKIESIAYPSSLVQQSFGETINNQGYLLWKLTKTNIEYSRRIILSDHGFSKLHISRGENIEERINNLQLSKNPKKTKVSIVHEDFEENYSLEKERQIIDMVKSKYGCETVDYDFRSIKKEEVFGKKNEDTEEKTFEENFSEYLEKFEFDMEEAEKKDIVQFALSVERELGFDKPQQIGSSGKAYSIDEVRIKNILSFPNSEIVIPFEEMKGITGVFGENYSGKSNLFKVIIWGLFGELPDENDSKNILNIYTGGKDGYVEVFISIDELKYKISRKAVKKGQAQTYPVTFEVFKDGVWSKEFSDEKTTEAKEVKNIILSAIGTCEDFTKVAYHDQDNPNIGYLKMLQQPKNDLIARYIGVSQYRERFELKKSELNEIKNTQKNLGSSVATEEEVKQFEVLISEEKNIFNSLLKDAKEIEEKKKESEEQLIDANRKIKNFEQIPYSSKDDLIKDISIRTNKNVEENEVLEKAINWLNENHKKEINVDPKRTGEIIEFEISTKREQFNKDKENYISKQSSIEGKSLHKIDDISEVRSLITNQKIKEHDLTHEILAAQGKKCQTCGSITEKPNPERVKKAEEELLKLKEEIQKNQSIVLSFEQKEKENKIIEKITQEVEVLKLHLLNKKTELDNLKKEFDLWNLSKDAIEHNKNVEKATEKKLSIEKSISERSTKLQELNAMLAKFEQNEKIKEENKATELIIDRIKKIIEGYRVQINQISEKISISRSKVMNMESSIKEKGDKLQKIKDADLKFRNLSIYLQAVDRDGIPSMIVRNKLPIINSKINSTIKNLVPFRVEMNMDQKGNIKEFFYFSEDKSDILPIVRASAAQKFLISIAIKDALNYVSKRNIVRPNIFMVDEGFGTLDASHISEIVTTLSYLKSKYYNVILTTHIPAIKDSVDHVIEASRDRSGIIDSASKDAFVSKFSFS